MKSLIAAAALMFSSLGFAGDAFEVCTDAGPCALRVTDTDTQEDIWLVTEENHDLSLIWDGIYWIVDQATYDEVLALVPERLTLPALNPTTGLTLSEAKAAPKPAPKPSTGGQSSGGGLITVGNITVGGGNPCAPCHTGSMKEIHAQIPKHSK